MPRYHFHVEDGTHLRDEDGVELPDLQAARCEAIKFAGSLICDAHDSFWALDDWRMTVTDADGLTLFCLILTSIEAASVASVARVGG